jgi:hypothetical protein
MVSQRNVIIGTHTGSQEELQQNPHRQKSGSYRIRLESVF